MKIICAVMTAFFVSGAALVWAEPAVQTPIQLGESEVSVRQKLGEPSKEVESNLSMTGHTVLWYQSRGLSLDIDSVTKTVQHITLIGEYRSEGWEVYSGKIAGDVDFSYSFDRVVQALGSSYQKDTFLDEEGGNTGNYYWDFETYTFAGEFWEMDYSENGRVYPKGGLKSAEIIKK